ncbi:MAG TPA: hypothetical protein VGS60_04500, partial [Actinomycetes bacterium]|nr:hypothetical protein [Actinomycetes bacterium]
MRWRTVVASVLIVLGCVLAPLSVLGVWTRSQLTDTDRYVETMAPLASHPDVQAALTNRITTAIMQYVNVADLVRETADALAGAGLPPRAADALRGLSGPAQAGASGFIHDQVSRVVQSDAFAAAWETVNRAAHKQLVAVLSGKSQGAVTVQGDTVTLDLAAFVLSVKQQLIDAGFTLAARIPDLHLQFTIIQSEDIKRGQKLYRFVDRFGFILPFVTLILLAGGVIAAKNRRRATVWAGLGVAISMVLLGAGLALGRSIYLDKLPVSVSSAAAAAVFDTTVRFLRTGLRSVLVIGLIVAAGTFLAGPSSAAVSTRAAFRRFFGRTRGNPWVYRNRVPLRIAVVGIAVLAYVFWNYPTGKVALLLAVLVVVAFAAIELLAGRGNGAGTPDDLGEATG